MEIATVMAPVFVDTSGEDAFFLVEQTATVLYYFVAKGSGMQQISAPQFNKTELQLQMKLES